MKKSIYVWLTALVLLVAVPAQAQFRWGVKAGLNLNKMSLNSKLKENLNTDNMTGFFVGPMVEFSLPVTGLGIDGSLVYSQRGFKYTVVGSTEKKSNRQYALEIPLHVRYGVGMGDLAGIFVFAGPSFSFNLKGEDIKVLDTSVFSRKNAEIGIDLGVGAKLFNHVQLAANYTIPVTKTGDGVTIGGVAKDLYSGKNKTWQISLAWMF
ncbi:MAG: porin family protein [Bacteroidaceae bacterium]